MTSMKWSPVYERHVSEDTVASLHQLCPACSRLEKESSLLQRLSRGDQLRLNTKETFKLCSVKELRAGYLGSCHLCALLWTHGGGHRFDPDKGIIKEPDITVYLEARDFELEYSLEYQTSGLQKWWNNFVPPFITELGVVFLTISKIYAKTSPPIIGQKKYELYIYPSSNRQLNLATLRRGNEPISSKNDMKLAQIESWYLECSKNHSKCTMYPDMVTQGSQLPSRLLDLQGNKIKLECNVESLPQLQYTTLSHMWGPDPNACLQLTQSRLCEFESDITSSLLPAKYLEAIRIAKALGFRYIWIDSLCIIQDSDEDWKKEALKMAAVYGRTALNISYVYPPSDNSSHKHLRDPRIIVPCELPMEYLRTGSDSSSSDSTSLVIQSVPGFINKFWSPTAYKHIWPLLGRAWVFQERLLCSRNIYYGQDRLLWECCEGLEDEFSGRLVDSPRSKSRFHSVFAGTQDSSQPRERVESFKGQWSLLVEEYRLANLTFEKDRVIAFAGIVKAVQSQTKFTYLAGIWKEFAELDLLWAYHPPSPLGDFYTRRDEMRKHAPSWSWFSVPAVLQSTTTNSDTIDFRIRTEIFNRSFHTIYKARIVSFHHPKLTSNPEALLHDLENLSITLKTRKIPSTLAWDGPVLRLLPHGRHLLGGEKYFDPKNAMKYVHDDVSLAPGSPVPSGTCMILTMFEAWVLKGKRDYRFDTYVPSGDEKATSWQYAGLAVVPAGKSATGQDLWQRIGVFVFSDSVDGLGVPEIPFSMDQKEEEVCLV
ncbi:hypothetical protein N0V84_010927 [Fusarium piperis]|uniref:Heterokaryon incompatibility domain-containing protein n=1 Tax=Fusarium piperis TaxID=1435070 RepID=A0A9W8W4H8_9HYPO|nr:hypothetical protein N0V84_010927 [Fusarium piperis]